MATASSSSKCTGINHSIPITEWHSNRYFDPELVKNNPIILGCTEKQCKISEIKYRSEVEFPIDRTKKYYRVIRSDGEHKYRPDKTDKVLHDKDLYK